MSLHYDLHTHSRASDGTLTATELVQRACAVGVDVLALTDHDSVDGLAEARAAAVGTPLRLIAGVEVSVTWNAQTVHIVGLNVDPDNAVFRAGLDGLQTFRDWRAEEIGRRLAKAGIADAFAGARRFASGRIVSRTHFAHFLVEQGRARTVREVFKKFLVNNKPGYVPGEWTTLEQALGWIHAAGGEAVVAHPARYPLTATKLRRLLGQFKECGGVAIEVVSGSHTTDDMQRMAGVARTLGLRASRGSDYHGPENPWVELGRIPMLPEGCVPVWQGWDVPAIAVNQ
ncbi:MAG: PHP domain-containing protein [Gammaproteobacteria bacterium]|nr:PHP domain-containing protein [Gammaproteobacteria bacterium]